MRFLTAVSASCPEHLEEATRQLWLRIWSRDEDISEKDSVKAAALQAGMEAGSVEQLLVQIGTPEIKERLKSTTAEAIELGVSCEFISVANYEGISLLIVRIK